MSSKVEIKYQNDLATRIKARIPGSWVLKNNPKDLQGIPDLLILIGPYWAMLEVKLSATSPEQPNQAYYIDEFGRDSLFTAFIYPEIEEEVLDALQSTFRNRR